MTKGLSVDNCTVRDQTTALVLFGLLPPRVGDLAFLKAPHGSARYYSLYLGLFLFIASALFRGLVVLVVTLLPSSLYRRCVVALYGMLQ